MNNSLLRFAFLGCIFFISCKKNVDPDAVKPHPATPLNIPLGGNAFVTKTTTGGTEEITDDGLMEWRGTGSIISTYFRLGQSGVLDVAIKAGVPGNGESDIKVSINDKPFTIHVAGGKDSSYYVGSVNINQPGYVRIDMQGVAKTGSCFANVAQVQIGGSATSANVIFANDKQNFYWSRRGPSGHLAYITPSGDKEYFYSEITVPEGQDNIGSYFMANGFDGGYFGMQVKSATERWIIFSVWDPESDTTSLIKKGSGVTAGRFGGEGEGGQSYLAFNWKAGTHYKFLTRGVPDAQGSTIFTSWFFAPEDGTWKLISSWKRPNTNTYLKGFYSFIENFLDEEGYKGRKAFYSNQWTRLATGTWQEVTKATFTVDATASNKQRVDVNGGVEGNTFYLQNGGFVPGTTDAGSQFSKSPSGTPPLIDLDNLP